MSRKLTLLFSIVATTLLLAGGAAASQKLPPYPIGLRLTGPRTIQPNVTTSGYIMVVKNNTKHTIHKLWVDFTPRSVIVKPVKGFRTIHTQAYPSETTAKWIRLRLKPGMATKVSMTLEFPDPTADSGSTFGIRLDAQQMAGGAFGHQFVGLHYK